LSPIPYLILRHRRLLNVVFGLFLVTGLTVGAYVAWALADWIRPEGEAGGAYLFLASRDRDVRLGVTLTTVHLVWWVLVIGIAASGEARAWGWLTRLLTIVEPGLYATGVTLVAGRWFRGRRRAGSRALD
jgi:hypothetical protein